MKDSGIKWIGEIPKEWEVVSVKNLFNITRGRVIPTEALSEEGYPVYSSQTLNNGCMGFIPTYDYSGDALTWTTDGANAGTVFFRTGQFNCTNVCGILQLKKELYNIHYLLYSVGHSSLHCRRADINGFKIMSNEMAAIKIVLPKALEEQQRIATFLDTKCGEIDELIGIQEKFVEELKAYKQSVITEAVTKGLNPNAKMKDSGVEWIGEIPEEWEVSRVGLHYNIILGKMLCPKQLDTTYTLEEYYCAANVHFEGISGELKKMWFNEKDKETYKTKNGDLLIVEGGAGAGGCAIVKDSSEDVFVQNSILIARPKSNNSCRYLKYLIEQYVKQGYIDIVCNKATIPHFTKDKVCNVPYLIMPSSEQHLIADYLDNKCSQIDSLIALKQSKTEELKSFKKSLIYEYVTGKKTVPETV